MAGLPAAAPSAAPAAAPTSVPIAAPPTVLSVAALLVVVPVCCAAHSRHTASSTWKVSKLLPVPGMTITLGPVGTLAHPLATSATMTAIISSWAPHAGADPATPARDGVSRTHRGRSGTFTHSSGQLGTVG